ncbi:hypothetical protein [Anaerotignum sp.]|uniref:hypothetical protein n=1 Tax=Anaerotignum sp. TaxID=2039241 RepID=UPI003AB6F165
MTPIVLLDNLAEFVKEQTANIILQVRTEPGADKKERAAEVHKMRLPKKEDSTRRIPYILLQILTGKDGKNDRGEQESICQIRIVVGTYSEDEDVGSYDVLNVIMRLRTELQRNKILAEQFVLQDPLEYIIYPDDYHPYYFGEMITNWSLPEIKQEVEQIWL